jgi:hypothetical protein
MCRGRWSVPPAYSSTRRGVRVSTVPSLLVQASVAQRGQTRSRLDGGLVAPSGINNLHRLAALGAVQVWLGVHRRLAFVVGSQRTL